MKQYCVYQSIKLSNVTQLTSMMVYRSENTMKLKRFIFISYTPFNNSDNKITIRIMINNFVCAH